MVIASIPMSKAMSFSSRAETSYSLCLLSVWISFLRGVPERDLHKQDRDVYKSQLVPLRNLHIVVSAEDLFHQV